jgi:hypothetical protein
LTSDERLSLSVGSTEHLCSRISLLHAKEETNISSCLGFIAKILDFYLELMVDHFLHQQLLMIVVDELLYDTKMNVRYKQFN